MVSNRVALLVNKGIEFGEKGNLKKSILYLKKAHKLLPQNPTINYNLGYAYKLDKRLGSAAKYFEKILKISPNDLETLLTLGSLYHSQYKFSKAISVYKKILNLYPNHPETLTNIGSLYLEKNYPSIAIKYLKKALRINPNLAKAYFNLGKVHYLLGQRKVAVKNINNAIKLDPSYSEAYNLQGQIYNEMDNTEKAIKSLGEAIKNKPNEAHYYLNLANILKNTKDWKKALNLYEKAVKIMPRFSKTYPNLYMQYRQICAWSKLPNLEKRIDRDNAKPFKEKFVPTETPFGNIFRLPNPKENLKVARRWSEAIEKSMRIFNMNFRFIRRKKKRIKVGYISADFQFHPVNIIMSPFYKAHDRKKFEIFAYCYGPESSDTYRKAVEDGVDYFKMIRKNHFTKAAKTIYEDGIDILVDLMGYTQNSVIEIVALKPAPIQISYLGFPGTSGSTFIDYIIADKTLIPQKELGFYTERVIYLPHCYQINHPYEISNKKYTRSDIGLPENIFIFASFSRPEKIEPILYKSWMNILKKAKNSILCLWVKPELEEARNNLLYYAQEQGVNVNRIYFIDQLPLSEHLERHSLFDLALDTMTYSGGHTTTLSLWAGLPVLTIKGSHYLSRMSESILKAVKLNDLICNNLTEYEKKAVSFSKHPNNLERVKKRLQSNRESTDIFNINKNIRYLENAYLKAWERYLNKLPATHIKIDN